MKTFTFLDYLYKYLMNRPKSDPSSYTNQLLSKDVKVTSQKVCEEASEVAIAAVLNDVNLHDEFADLFYHTLVLMIKTDTKIEDVIKVLDKRHNKKKGLE